MLPLVALEVLQVWHRVLSLVLLSQPELEPSASAPALVLLSALRLALASWLGLLSESAVLHPPKALAIYSCRFSNGSESMSVQRNIYICFNVSINSTSAGSQSTESNSSLVSHLTASYSFNTKFPDSISAKKQSIDKWNVG